MKSRRGATSRIGSYYRFSAIDSGYLPPRSPRLTLGEVIYDKIPQVLNLNFISPMTLVKTRLDTRSRQGILRLC